MDWGNVTAGELMDALREVRCRARVSVCAIVYTCARAPETTREGSLKFCYVAPNTISRKLSRWPGAGRRAP